ncbi:MAG: hypothetical protein IKY23_05980 [Lachnospiraceae bacterium]|nr:hypothetical protein [Lachnospiraceae bacterium]
MKKENNCTNTKRCSQESLSEINKIRQTANKNLALCKEREQFFFYHQNETPLKAQTGAFAPSDDKTAEDYPNTSQKGYMAGLRLRFVFSVLLFSAVIISSSYIGGKYIDILQKLQNLLTETMQF